MANTEQSVSYSEALALLEQARDLDAFVDEQGSSRANSWEVRRALQVSKRLYAAAQVSATLAVVDELRRSADLALTTTTVNVNGDFDPVATARKVVAAHAALRLPGSHP